MLKRCSRCKIEKDLIDFCVRKRNKSDGRSSFCKECNKQYQKEHYKNNKKDYLEKEKNRRKKFYEWIWSVKKNLKCEECGETHPACLDFHHKDQNEKEFTISQMRSFSKEKIEKEMNKCLILCCKCHRIWHWEN